MFDKSVRILKSTDKNVLSSTVDNNILTSVTQIFSKDWFGNYILKRIAKLLLTSF